MSPTKGLLKSSRLLHLYLGIFTAPALMFFSFTGAVQTFSLHETTRGSDYKPPQILVKLAQLHKKQTLVVPVKKPQPTAPDAAAKHADKGPDADSAPTKRAEKASDAIPSTPRPAEPPPARPKNLLPMKIFFLFVAVSLFLSTLTGLYMSYKYIRNKMLVTACLVAGIVVPVLLALL